MRRHFSKLKNAFAKCADISQKRKMALQNVLAFLKNENGCAICADVSQR
jgi:hypothetical protein